MKSDKEWQAENDAMTLSSAADIMNSKKRRKAALAASEKHAKAVRRVTSRLKEVFGK